MAAPYSIQIEEDITSNIRVLTEDDAIIFYCREDARIVNREITFYDCANSNFIYDNGEEIGTCNFTIETIPDISPPEFIAPPDIEIPCGYRTDPDITGDVFTASDNCEGLHIPFIDFTDEIEEGEITTITRTWIAFDNCGNSSEQIQTITINCESECVPPNVGTFDCGN